MGTYVELLKAEEATIRDDRKNSKNVWNSCFDQVG